MSKNCPKCGNPLDEGALFCDNCGIRLGAQPQQTPPRPYAQPQQQYPRQAQQYAPYQPPYQQNQPAPQPPKKKKTGLIIGLICGGTALLIAAVLVVIFVVMPMLNKPGGNQPPKPQTTVTEQATKQVPELTTAMPEEPKTAVPTEAPTEPPTAPPTQAPTQPKAELPYENSLGSVKPTDFTWISDAKSGMKGSFISRDDLVGKWKGMFKYDGIWELVYVTIDTDSTVTVQPDQINYGDGWESEAGDAPYIFSGGFDIDRVYGSGEYGTLDLYQFLETGGTQYAQGKLSASKTGMEAEVYLVRP